MPEASEQRGAEGVAQGREDPADYRPIDRDRQDDIRRLLRGVQSVDRGDPEGAGIGHGLCQGGCIRPRNQEDGRGRAQIEPLYQDCQGGIRPDDQGGDPDRLVTIEQGLVESREAPAKIKGR